MDVPTTQLLTQAQHRVERPPRTAPVHVYFVQCVRTGGGGTLDHAVKALADARRDADKLTMHRYRYWPCVCVCAYVRMWCASVPLFCVCRNIGFVLCVRVLVSACVSPDRVR